jgi:phosphoribosylformylglycinamidine synthase
LRLLSSPSICSKEWVIRQYDHEVQGGSVVKPLVGVQNDGPSDAAVITPILGSTRGLAIGCGINPRYGDLDPYWMAASAIDEAVRNVVAVGADPSRIAILDNFCWGNTDRPETLGSLVRAAEACRDVAIAYGTPFISGKDSLNNEFHAGDVHITIPPTLLVSALGIVPDVRKCVTMDLKRPGNWLYLLGVTKAELGGSHYHLVQGLSGGQVPEVDLESAPRLFKALHEAIQRGWVSACHDLSEGGLAVALAEMCFAGGLGARCESSFGALGLDEVLFAESNNRFLVEAEAAIAGDLEAHFRAVACPCLLLGEVTSGHTLVISASGRTVLQASVAELKEAWQRPLRC